MYQSLVSLWIALVMTFVNFVPGFVVPEDKSGQVDKSYPYIFVHGFLGWGEDEGINQDLSYWGATACHLIPKLREQGIECWDASVGPFSSNWDRACELYAQLTGTRVDYGAAHSEKHNHLRYGRTYSEPLFEGWGEKDENGLMNKVNLIGHSFGGNTIRLLQGLLSQGDAAEREATAADDISPLFVGGKADWVNSVTTICTPNNGTTMKYMIDDLRLLDVLEISVFLYAAILGRSQLNGYVDFHMEQFGLTYVPGEKTTVNHIYKAISIILDQKYDNVAYDLSCEGAKELNDRVGLDDNVYYYSYAFRTTVDEPVTGKLQIALPSTLALLRPFSEMMGIYPGNPDSVYTVDETWKPNDGLVSVVSAKYPFDDPYVDYDPENIQTGIWNVMPLSTGDHGNAIGIGVTEDALLDYYMGMIKMIESQPITD